ncbi:DNA-binding Lrp family transcriptional regulator [Actinocorallia herbida]|uniref:DNA-binding Lrp family transcriptional regulator n=1 Tax=Actinocorallia herbida TaxID=58109 RepID=A0A3N1CR58_9ACTN|nr:AsnC family transcriptional regulator [Actinocorallia herbida]ROO83801.1 DNA-binding Lrp family transcriptional regulator [Actinocorallia herbida]
MERISADHLDLQIAHALALDGRASFSRIATVLGVSDQTVARRYRRLRAQGALRVVGLCDHRRTGGSRWWVRLQCAPGSAPALADALARRPDTAWIQLLAGGTELLCGVHSLTEEDEDGTLLERLPRTARVVAVTAQSILHQFAGAALRTDHELISALTPEQEAALVLPPPPPLPDSPLPLDALDRALFTELGLDARASHADLAAATGWSESTVRRRLDHLEATGVLFTDLEIDIALLGLRTCAWLWLDVHPADLERVGAELAGHPEIVFAAATTGPTNLTASVCCRDPRSLYRYLNDRVGPLPGVRRSETVLISRTVKQSGSALPARRRGTAA